MSANPSTKNQSKKNQPTQLSGQVDEICQSLSSGTSKTSEGKTKLKRLARQSGGSLAVLDRALLWISDRNCWLAVKQFLTDGGEPYQKRGFKFYVETLVGPDAADGNAALATVARRLQDFYRGLNIAPNVANDAIGYVTGPDVQPYQLDRVAPVLQKCINKNRGDDILKKMFAILEQSNSEIQDNVLQILFKKAISASEAISGKFSLVLLIRAFDNPALARSERALDVKGLWKVAAARLGRCLEAVETKSKEGEATSVDVSEGEAPSVDEFAPNPAEIKAMFRTYAISAEEDPREAFAYLKELTFDEREALRLKGRLPSMDVESLPGLAYQVLVALADNAVRSETEIVPASEKGALQRRLGPAIADALALSVEELDDVFEDLKPTPARTLAVWIAYPIAAAGEAGRDLLEHLLALKNVDETGRATVRNALASIEESVSAAD